MYLDPVLVPSHHPLPPHFPIYLCWAEVDRVSLNHRFKHFIVRAHGQLEKEVINYQRVEKKRKKYKRLGLKRRAAGNILVLHGST